MCKCEGAPERQKEYGECVCVFLCCLAKACAEIINHTNRMYLLSADKWHFDLYGSGGNATDIRPIF